MCRLLGVSSSGYYARVKRRPSQRAETDATLTAAIRTAHTTSRGIYGAPRVYAELAARGLRVGRKRVARLMSQAGLTGVSRRKFVVTTVRGDSRQAPDLVERNFAAEVPDRLWVADITYIPTGAGFLYLAVVLDACSRRIVGWSMATTLATQMVLDALNMALLTRRPESRDPSLGSGFAVYLRRVRSPLPRGRRPPLDGLGRQRLRQRHVRELLRHPRMRAARSLQVQDAGRGEKRGIRVHRRILQSATPSLIDRLSLTDRLRAPTSRSRCRFRRTSGCRRARGHQGQTLRAAAGRGRP
jgi:putative transposase